MILRYFLYGLYILMYIYWAVMFVGIIMSWIPNANRYGFCRVIRKIGDAYLGPFRGLLVIGFLDFTPVLGFILYRFIINIVAGFIS